MRVPPTVLFLSLLLAGCSDPLAPGQGALRIALSVVGIDGDPNGYHFTIDGRHPGVLQGPGELTMTVGSGRHTVSMAPLASNCSAVTPTAQEAKVSPSDTALVAFAIECRAATGVIEIRSATTGADSDPDGYFVSLDGGTLRGLWSSGTVRYSGVPAGVHSVALSGMSPNCTVSGPNPRTDVQVTSGGLARDTTKVSFDVACADTTGAVRVITATSGSSPDTNGYLVTAAPGLVTPRRVLPNDTIVVGRIRPGTVSVGIGDIATNCLSTGQNPKTTAVTMGDTTEVRFDVSCVAPGTVRVTANVTGPDPDSSYQVSVDGGPAIPLPAGAQLSLNLVPGSRNIQLLGVASNCAVSGANPVVVSVTAGATTDVPFDVACTPIPRTGLDVIITTSGTNLDSGYLLQICDYYYCYWSPYWEQRVLSNDSLQLDFPPGPYSFNVWDVAGNCSGPTSGSFDIQPYQVTTLRLDFTCGAPTTVRLTAPTTGQIPTGTYYVKLDSGSSAIPLLPNGSSLFDLNSGPHSFLLFGLPPGCVVSGANPVAVDLPAMTVTDVSFSVNCTPPGQLLVSASTGGSDLDQYYGVEVDGQFAGSLSGPGATVSTNQTAGTHSVLLTDVAPNCTVTSPNPATVTVPSGSSTSLIFAVFCDPNPTLRVTVTTTGTIPTGSYLVGVDPDWYYWYYYTYSAAIGPNGVASLKVLPGDHFVTLDQVPLACSVTSPNNIRVTVPLGTTTDVAFTVACP
jgi:hypothetical protein